MSFSLNSFRWVIQGIVYRSIIKVIKRILILEGKTIAHVDPSETKSDIECLPGTQHFALEKLACLVVLDREV